MGAEGLLQDGVDDAHASGEHREDAAQERGPHVELAAQRLAVGRPGGVAPVGDPHRRADDQQRGGKADRVFPIGRCDPDDRRLGELGQCCHEPECAVRPCGQRDERGEVGVQASDGRLPVRLLRPGVAREPPADQDPRDSVDEKKRPRIGQRGHDVGPRVPWVAHAQAARQGVVEDLGCAVQRRADAERDDDESLEGPQRGVAVLADVLDRDDSRVHTPQEQATDGHSRGSRQGVEAFARVESQPRPGRLQQGGGAAQQREHADQERDVHVPATEGRGPALLAGGRPVAPSDEEVEAPDGREDHGRPPDLGCGERVERESIEIRLQQLHYQRGHGDHRRDRGD